MNKIIYILSSPIIQVVSFSILLVGNNDFGLLLLIWLILNLWSNLLFSIIGLTCLLPAVLSLIIKNSISLSLQLISSILMVSFVIFGEPGKYFNHFILQNRLSTLDVMLIISTFLFFTFCQICVIIVFLNKRLKLKKSQ